MSNPASETSSSQNPQKSHVIQVDHITTEDGIATDELMAEATSFQISSSTNSERNLRVYKPLYQAAFEGNWLRFQIFIELNNTPVDVAICSSGKTALHIAVYSGQTKFAQELIQHQLMLPPMLEKQDDTGHTALFYAVAAGDLEAVKAMVEINPILTLIANIEGTSPILEAAQLGKKDLLLYLYKNTKDKEKCKDQDPRFENPFRGKAGLKLLNAIIVADFYDVAIDLVNLYPELARPQVENVSSYHYLGAPTTTLEVLARRSTSFKRSSNLSFWQKCIYLVIHVPPSGHLRSTGYLEEENQSVIAKDSKGITKIFNNWKQGFFSSRTNLVFRAFKIFWGTIIRRVPFIKSVQNTKLMHQDALELVNYLCKEIEQLPNYSKFSGLVVNPFLVAAQCGNVDFLLVCLKYFPALLPMEYQGHTILHYCIINRQKEVFKILCNERMRSSQRSLAAYQVENGGTVLHLAAKIGPAEQLKTISGAALQMQSEIQWFKAVDQITKPTYREFESTKWMKPRELFLKEHEQLLEKGEKWMRELASSCSVVAALIATMVFTAAFTVPGGNDQNKGIPMFLRHKHYMVFAISDALALMFSLTSALIFLSALTSRYDAEDFIKSLPNKIIFGLATLFVSIASMATAFMATYFIMFSTHFAGVALFVALLFSIPAILFAFSQFPLFIEVYISTYGGGVIYRENDEMD